MCESCRNGTQMEERKMEKQESCSIVGAIMYFELKENKPHGTKDDPFSTYHIQNGGQSFQIPVHWHDELEIIYVKSGFLTVNISGDWHCGLFYLSFPVKIYSFP